MNISLLKLVWGIHFAIKKGNLRFFTLRVYDVINNFCFVFIGFALYPVSTHPKNLLTQEVTVST